MGPIWRRRLEEGAFVALLAALLSGVFWWACAGTYGSVENPTVTRAPLSSDRTR